MKLQRQRSIQPKNPDFHHIIRMDFDQTQLLILNVQLLEIQVLSIYYRHSRIQSFIRQLNLYGFQRIKNSKTIKFTHEKLKLGKSLRSLKSKHQISRQLSRQRKRNQIKMLQNDQIEANKTPNQSLEINNPIYQAQQNVQQETEQKMLSSYISFDWNCSYENYMQYLSFMSNWNPTQGQSGYFIMPFTP